MTSAPGRKFGRYLSIDKLGSGGMGEVFLVLDPQTGGLFALKALLKDHTAKELELFRGEAKTLAKLQTPYIESFREFISGEENWIVKEFIDGISLNSFLEAVSAPLDLSLALHLASRILAGLHYLHTFHDPAHGGGSQLVHGDLSPNNVMVTFTGQTKLIDLGLSCFPRRVLNPAEKTSWMSLRYSSPQRILSQRRSVDDDLFAFGLIVWKMVSGESYWGNLTSSDIQRQARNFSPRRLREALPSASEELEAFVRACMWHEDFYGFPEVVDAQEALASLLAQCDLPMAEAELASRLQFWCADAHTHSKRRQNIARLYIENYSKAV